MSTLGNFGRFVITSIVLFAFVSIGYIAGQRGLSPQLESAAYGLPGSLAWESASGGRQISLATGRIDDGVEGVFALDHLTGDLFCWFLNPRDGSLSRSLPLNAAQFLNVDGESDYVMCTGLLNIRGGRSGNERAGASVVYVGDGNSGRVAAFSVIYSGNAVRLENIPASREMMTRDPRAVRDQGTGR
jgi:hypothetical protein